MALELEPGTFVLVPFGPQSRIGVVWDCAVGDTGKAVDPKKLKTIAARRRRAAAAAELAALCRVDRALHARARSAWSCA